MNKTVLLLVEAAYTGGLKPVKNWNKFITNTYPDDPIKSAVYDYVAGYTTQVNDLLRNGFDKNCMPITSILDQAFIDQKIIDVYRTVEWDYMTNRYGITPENINEHIGDILTNEGYMSTAAVMSSPWGNQWFDTDVILHIVSTKPYPCIDINKMFKSTEIDCAEQEEILLPRRTSLKLMSYKYIKDSGVKTKVNKYGNYLIELMIV